MARFLRKILVTIDVEASNSLGADHVRDQVINEINSLALHGVSTTFGKYYLVKIRSEATTNNTRVNLIKLKGDVQQ